MATAARTRELRLVALAIAVSSIGDFIAVLALALHANEIWKGGGVSLLLIALWSPAVLLAGHVGVIVDRIETRGLAIAAALLQAALALALAFVGSLAAILTLTVLLGVGAAVAQSAEFALIPLLAGTRTLSRANGLIESARSVGFAVGPLIGGALAAGAGTRIALLVDAATFVVIAAVLAAVPVRRRIDRRAGAPVRARDGLRLLISERVLATALGAGALTLLFMSASIPADFVYTQDTLHRSGVAVGLVLTVWATGMIVASNTLPQRVPVHAIATVALLAAALQGFAKFVVPFWTVFPFMVAWYAVGGVGHGLKNTLLRTLIHTRVEPARHGQAFAAYNGLRNGAELFALAGGGLLVATIGGSGTLWIAGGASALAGLAGVVVLSTRAAPAAQLG
jgi:hypothetical protein